MTFDQATEHLPVNVREFLRTNMNKQGIPEDDPIRSVALAQAELTVMLDKRRNVLLGMMAVGCVFGMSLSSLAGYWYGQSHTPRSVPVALSLPKASTLDGKDVLIVDTKTWDLRAWIHADRAFVFPARTGTGTSAN